MSNRITSCEYIGPWRLTITSADLGRARYELGRKGNGMRIIPEGSFLDDARCLKKIADGIYEIMAIGWETEGSGFLETLAEALSYTKGSADIMQVWEGARSVEPFTGLRVVDGKVTKRMVNISLGDEVTE